jgi:hypothetical protein
MFKSALRRTPDRRFESASFQERRNAAIRAGDHDALPWAYPPVVAQSLQSRARRRLGEYLTRRRAAGPRPPPLVREPP